MSPSKGVQKSARDGNTFAGENAHGVGSRTAMMRREPGRGPLLAVTVRAVTVFPLVVVALTVGVLTGCGSSRSTDQTFVRKPKTDVFADVPLPLAIDASNPLVRADGVTTLSYEVFGISAQQTFAFFETELSSRGWRQASGPRSGVSDYGAVWEKGSRRLTVTTSPMSRPGWLEARVDLQLADVEVWAAVSRPARDSA